MDFRNKICLAPMAGVTDSPFRMLCRRLGAEVVWSEMVSADGLVRGGEKTGRLLEFGQQERPVGLQLFGADPETVGQAAEIAAGRGPDFLDLNFGCPVPKVVRRNGGVSLMRTPELAGEITRAAVSGAGDVPVSVKIRSGWNSSSINFLRVAEVLFRAGAAAISFHARTREQGYGGRADWGQIRSLKEMSPVPVIGSGDIVEPEDARRMIEETGCDSVMIGRACLGNPWLFGRCRAVVDGLSDPGGPLPAERFSLALEHLDMNVEKHGEKHGVLLMRKHLGWYTRSLTGGAELRRQLFAVGSRNEVAEIFDCYLEKDGSTR